MTTLIPKYDQGSSGAVNRPINQKLAETVSVLDFGADPTGVADSTTAITNAVTAVQTGGSLYFPVGTYLTTGVTINKSITIYGDGIGSTIKCNTTGIGININFATQTQVNRVMISSLDFTNGTNTPSAFISNTNALNTLIEKCNFIGVTATYCIVNTSSYGIIIRECTFDDITGSGIQFQENTGLTNYSYACRVIDCDFTIVSNQAVNYQGGNPGYFESCIFENCGGVAVQLGSGDNSLGTTFTNCYWEANTGVDLFFTSTYVNTAVIINATFTGTPQIDLGSNTKLTIIGANAGGGSNICQISGNTNSSVVLLNAPNYANYSNLAGWTYIANEGNPTSYTPTWSADSVNPAIGNGTLTGSYQRIGNIVNYVIALTTGTTTTYGTGAWFFSLPFAPIVSGSTGTATINLISMGQTTPTIASNSNIYVLTSSGKVSSTVPITWNSGETLYISGSYFV